MIIRMLKIWKSYRHRFVPWIVLNLKNRSKRVVEAGQKDKIASDCDLISTLLHLLPNLSAVNTCMSLAQVAERNRKVVESVLGFCVMRAHSKVPGAGIGVVIAGGRVKKGTLVALYPGTLYHPHEPILLPSVGNAFVLRCLDGIHVDGNDRRLSKMIYNRSCVRRDSVWPHQAGDLTWLTEHPVMPLNIGQYVNNHSPGFPANVIYQELDVSLSCILPDQRCFLPNIWYSGSSQHDHLRLVALVSTTDIEQGDELFSSYYTVIH